MARAFAHGAMGRRVDHSCGGPIELFLVPASAPRLVIKGRGMCYPVCGMVHIKKPLLLIGKSRPTHVAASGFLSHNLSGPVPYVRCHITVNKMC